MNPNQLMFAKAMVAQEALREEARRSRDARRSAPREKQARVDHARTRSHSVFGFLGLALPGRR